MFHTKDHKTGYLFDQGPFGWLGPRRKRLIDTSWAKLFREKILPSLPVNTLMQHYHLSQGAPTKELYTMLGVMVLQQMFDLTDEETVSQYAFNIQWHYALDITGESDAVAYLSPKTLWNMRKLFCENDLYKDIFDSIAAILATAFAVDTSSAHRFRPYLLQHVPSRQNRPLCCHNKEVPRKPHTSPPPHSSTPWRRSAPTGTSPKRKRLSSPW